MSNAVIWYREPWVWFVISVPGSAVVFGILMVVMAQIHRDDTVVDDYYKEGMAINRELSQHELAVTKQVSAVLTVDGAGELNVAIEGADDSAVSLAFHHVSSRERDVR